MKFVTVSEMQAIEQEADSQGLTYSVMMENAGRSLAEEVQCAYSHLEKKNILALVGSGNNGGDALVALTYLAERGWQTSAYIVRERDPNDPMIARLREEKGQIYKIEQDDKFAELSKLLRKNTVLLDGILGTGIQLPLRGDLAKVIEHIRSIVFNEDINVVAVDCPSGVDSDNGEVAPETIPAELTVTMAAVKAGLLKFPAYNLIGELRVGDIGLTEDKKRFPTWSAVKRFVADKDMVRGILPERPLNSHKGTFGTALIIAGSVNYTGAVLLAGEAAFRVGTGLITLAVPYPLHAALAGNFPEATWLLLPHELGVIAENAVDVLDENINKAASLLIGPGLGLEDTTADFMCNILGGNKRLGRGDIGFVHSSDSGSNSVRAALPSLVIDADGLKLLTKIDRWAERLPNDTVLTPHPGEMAVLTGLSKDKIQSDRIGIAEKYAQEWGHVVVLKGAFTVIAHPDGMTAIIPVASPALARAGTGDVLAGLITGLRAQGVNSFQSAVAGAWIHAQAGLRAAEILGSSASVIAGDLLLGVIDVMAGIRPGS